jgi:hypothetical protein
MRQFPQFPPKGKFLLWDSISTLEYIVKNFSHDCFDDFATFAEKVAIVEIASISAIEEISAIATFADKNMMTGDFPTID